MFPPSSVNRPIIDWPQSTFPMSQSPSTSVVSLRFQTIFDAALKSYQRQTKKDILAHPLASQLQSCDSTSAILSVLQDQVREFDHTYSGDEGMIKWLTPTVNVLFAFSAAVSGGVGLVSLEACNDVNLSHMIFRHFRLRLSSLRELASLFRRVLKLSSWSVLSHFDDLTSAILSYRRPRTLRRVKMFSQNCLNASDTFSIAFKPIQMLRQLRR